MVQPVSSPYQMFSQISTLPPSATLPSSMTHTSDLLPLSWLIGTWLSVLVRGHHFPGQHYNFTESMTFKSFGPPPVIFFVVAALDSATNEPKHMESGFLEMKPGSKREVAMFDIHMSGITF